MGLTLSQVRGWDTTHLIDAADHWDRVATEWEASFDAVHRESLAPGGTEWDGRAADAAHERTALDRVRALATVDGLRAQAGAARAGAEDLWFAQRQVLDLVDAVHEQGFVVGEDFTVSDTNANPPMIAARRREVAAGHTAALRTQVHNLAGTDAEVAGNLNRGIQAVDFRTAPLPTDGPSPQPAPGGDGGDGGDAITTLMLPPPPTAVAPRIPVQSFYDQIVGQLAQRPPPDPLVLEALRQAYAANHQACNTWQWAGGWLGLGGSTAGLFASIPELVPPVTPVGALGVAASLAGMGGSGAALIDCATR